MQTSTSAVQKLARLGLHSDEDVILHLPSRYEDETQLMQIQDLDFRAGEVCQVEGVVTACETTFRPRKQLVVTLADGDHVLTLRFLHFYASQTKQFAEGVRIRARGEIRHGFFGTEMVHPTFQRVVDHVALPITLTPVYPAGDKISQKFLRSAISSTLTRADLSDTLSPAILSSLKLPSFEKSLRFLHAPTASADVNALEARNHPAWQRMKFDELLAQQFSIYRARAEQQTMRAQPLREKATCYKGILEQLPFSLTNDQERVLDEISTDLQQHFPMHRLLQGDVGSGKTIVAALAAAQAIDSGCQVAFMAPTEILAEQHYHQILVWMQPLGIHITFLTGSQKKKGKLAAHADIESGKTHIIIGTHALIQSSVKFSNLGLAIIDEQHRFGVEQRYALRKGGDSTLTPHQLMMSATPIPRTLAMTYYADLNISSIHSLPPGRTPITTRLVDQSRRHEVIERIHAAALEGRQTYWVCPLIEESETLQLQTANDTAAALSDALPELNVGLVHGRLSNTEKQRVMRDFIQGDIHLLVATTVIEVGVNVPNASLMVIENAERFGLSQLHQLRGRVGRGEVSSVCLLLYQRPIGENAKSRLVTMRETNDGFEIAHKDLALRGPGEFLGARQSGVPMLRFADLSIDTNLLESAQKLAASLINHETPENTAMIEAHLSRWMKNRAHFLHA